VRGYVLPKLLLARLVGAPALVLLCLTFLVSGRAEAAVDSYIDFDSHDTQTELAAGREDGVVVRNGSARLLPGRTRGTVISKAYATATRFDTLIPSWNASTPSGTWMQTDIRVRSGERWTPWFNMGVWVEGTETVKRHSVNGQGSGSWKVLTETLQAEGPVFAEAYQYRLTLSTKKRSGSPEVRAVYVTASNSYRHADFLGVSSSSQLLGKDLPVPQRSQMIYPNGGEVWCSPTSLSMVMAYWASKTGNRNLNQLVPTVAAGTYDYAYQGNGNWPFNTAYASTFGLKASINRFSSLEQVERWISKDVPVIVSLSWGSGQLDGAPVPASNGHLLVIRGFHSDGERIMVNDPAADGNSRVKRLYNRQQFADAWFRGSGGIAYLVYPKVWDIPDQTSSRGSW
jgi:hypothetical protein